MSTNLHPTFDGILGSVMPARASHDGWKNADFLVALDDYCDAVASRKYWEDHGTHGDHRLSDARADERAARRGLERRSGSQSTHSARARACMTLRSRI